MPINVLYDNQFDNKGETEYFQSLIEEHQSRKVKTVVFHCMFSQSRGPLVYQLYSNHLARFPQQDL